MRVIIRKTYEEISVEAAKLVTSRIEKKPEFVLGLATGSSPLGLYRELINLNKKGVVSFKKVKTFNLDEYYGLKGDHPQSYRYFMNTNLFDHIDIDKANTMVPDGTAQDWEEFCRHYEQKIKEAGGIDLQVLGIGSDGHIAFNEPGSSLASRTRLVALDAQTIEDNSRFFEDKNQVPRFALSMGVGTILEAKEIILIANGKNKAKAIAQAIEGPLTSMISASALQMHPKVSYFLDEEAASELKRINYYKFVEEAEKKLGKEIF
ncbi:MAG TPA: glucosamine-6-phosphate deaminase [bacterium]|nr:glucosamine-6-phosphate deaminase [bacterium]HPO52809.1 glucosamine-6-phosphate deaminase [bacterium]